MALACGAAEANALGSGLVESPVFMAFLPGLCRELLGEELKLPSVATWWCHDPAARPKGTVLGDVVGRALIYDTVSK